MSNEEDELDLILGGAELDNEMVELPSLIDGSQEHMGVVQAPTLDGISATGLAPCEERKWGTARRRLFPGASSILSLSLLNYKQASQFIS